VVVYVGLIFSLEAISAANNTPLSAIALAVVYLASSVPVSISAPVAFVFAVAPYLQIVRK